MESNQKALEMGARRGGPARHGAYGREGIRYLYKAARHLRIQAAQVWQVPEKPPDTRCSSFTEKCSSLRACIFPVTDKLWQLSQHMALSLSAPSAWIPDLKMSLYPFQGNGFLGRALGFGTSKESKGKKKKKKDTVRRAHTLVWQPLDPPLSIVAQCWQTPAPSEPQRARLSSGTHKPTLCITRGSA